MKRLIAIILLASTCAFGAVGPNIIPLLSAKGATLPAQCTVGQLFFKTDADPGQNIYECAATDSWTQQVDSGAAGASKALDDLAAVHINTSLLAQTGVDLGSTTHSFQYLYLNGDGSYGTNTFKLTGTPTGSRVLTLPDTTDTLVGKATTDELTSKTLTASVGKGTWTASGTWTLPAITLGGTVSGGGNQLNNIVIGTSTPLAGSFTTVSVSTTYGLASGHITASATAPTIDSGFGTGASVTANNGTAAFTIDVGTGGVATSGVITMPAATTGWICSVNNLTTKAAHHTDETYQTATTSTSVTIENQTTASGAATAWDASDVIQLACTGY